MNTQQLKRCYDKAPVILCTGQSGCGKGTLFTNLRKTYKEIYPEREMFVSETGELFTQEIPKFSPWIREKLAANKKESKLQPSVFAISLWAHKILYESSRDEPIFIDGSPRSIDEAKALVSTFLFLGKQMIFFHIKVSDKEAARRIEARNTFLLSNQLPIRDDCSTPEQINTKLAYFHTSVLPAIEYLKTQSSPELCVYEIHSDEHTSATEIYDQVVDKLILFHC